jgi:hypothetical protein
LRTPIFTPIYFTPICYLRTITLYLIGVSVSYHLFSLTMSDHFDFTLSFLDRDTMINGVKSFYQQKGYVIVIQKSKKGKVWFKCDLGGQHRNPEGLTDETRKRKTSTRLSGCQFKISSYLGAKDQLWHVTPHELSHNHEASSDLSGHSIARPLNIEEKKAVISLPESGVGPSQILSILKKDFNNKLSGRKEIHNFLAETRLKMLGDKTPIQKLLEILQENDFHYAYKTSVSGANTNLFFSHLQVHRTMSELWKCFCYGLYIQNKSFCHAAAECCGCYIHISFF